MAINPDDIHEYIEHDTIRQSRIARQLAYVKGENPAILEPRPKEEPDNRITVSFARRGKNLVLGYGFKEGNIIYSGGGFDKSLQETFDSNDEGLLNFELADTVLTHGEAYEAHWATGGIDQFAQIPINQCIAIYDKSLKPELTGFIRHWQDGKLHYAYIYDSSTITKYVSENGKDYIPELDSKPEEHGYGRVPIVHFRMSRDGSNLFDHTTALIDFYDKIMSEDFANELAKFASSYMLMAGQISNGVDANGETEIDKIKRTKFLQNLSGEKSIFDQIGFLTKDINADFVNTAADRTERLVYEMMQVINTDDENFVQASGESQKWRLIAFEYLITTIMTYFSVGLQDRISLIKHLGANMSAGNNSINTDVTIKFNRNLPDDILKIAQIYTLLGGKDLSIETLLKLFPSTIIEDVDEEKDRIEEREVNAVDLFKDVPATPLAPVAPVSARPPVVANA